MTLQLDGLDIGQLHDLYNREYTNYFSTPPLDEARSTKRAQHAQNVIAVLTHVADGDFPGDNITAKEALINIYAYQQLYRAGMWAGTLAEDRLRDDHRAAALMRSLPEDRQIPVYLGRYSFHGNDYDQAIAYLQKDLGQDPEGLYLMGQAHEKKGPEHLQRAYIAYAIFIHHSDHSDDPRLHAMANDATRRAIKIYEAMQGIDGLRGMLTRAVMERRGHARSILGVTTDQDIILFPQLQAKPAG
jgi:tetratricopeptide (TPR) repeat protein